DPLFVIDDRAARAEVEVRKAAVAIAEQSLTKLQSAPRPEDVPPAEAKVKESAAQLEDAKTQLALWESVTDPRAVAKDELNKRRYAVDTAAARLSAAAADLAKLKAGTWKPDLEIAQAELESARAQLKSAETDLDRLTVRALVDGQVMQLNVRPGEYAP